jgi:hypothetical protein
MLCGPYCHILQCCPSVLSVENIKAFSAFATKLAAHGSAGGEANILGDACRLCCVAHLIDHALQMGAELFGNLAHDDMGDGLH